MIIKNAKIFDGEKFTDKDAVVIEDKKIKKVANTSELSEEELKNHEVVDINGMILSPGFLDLQINGCGGVLFNDDISRKALEIMNETNKRFGCTSFLPTLITSPDEKIEKALDLIKEMQDKEEIGVLGLHIEGPYISVEKKGIHRPEYIRILSDEMIQKIADAGPEVTKIITIAPEKAKVEHLKTLKNAGLNIAVGHTNATYEECMEKKEYFNCATHLYNAMSPLESRNPGVIGFLFNNDTTNCGIIIDGFHMEYPSAEIAKKILKERLYLVTDAVSPAGTDNMTEFMFEGNRVLYENGRCYSPLGTLGGSALVMIDGVKNLVQHVHVSQEEALRMATSYPAKAISVNDRYGYIKEGYIADLTYFDDNYKVKGTVAKGNLTKY
ncbi:N-acetylglucosamine-6-phosphate deacetylase [Pseudoleptotrichia goodfellowii]|uniref:N-acetylglucosamine-6-phosphate deacetylase n=2 Tax=Pseudoleptotrichia goodfellowii TaxID=157692 RepID=D0GJ48_9FUSO|nr:N-acetylglucosamine-6-phosphate deacetylase [Pseudoleptotrichia goodfellowii]EEY35897.1 N-acetylglucosamine-6-phosphate deacetylase [Pseudoleptotrichia goodfellowii F0264]BBM35324.1 N-acetylglucosamine-6-phosphate deacetylase [Pseudoleptotrichia goodfellowii]